MGINNIKRRLLFKLSSKYHDFSNHFQSKNKYAISFIGSSVTQGAGASLYHNSWVSLLSEQLKQKKKMVHYNNGFGSYNIKDLVNENKQDLLLAQNPNLVIIETCDINNYGDNIPIDEVEHEIEIFYNYVAKNLPNAKIIVLPSNPTPRKLSQPKNKCGLLYKEYKDQTKQFCINNKWEYVDFWNDFFAVLNKKHIDFENCFIDQVHPNDIGYSIWFEAIKDKITIA